MSVCHVSEEKIRDGGNVALLFCPRGVPTKLFLPSSDVSIKFLTMSLSTHDERGCHTELLGACDHSVISSCSGSKRAICIFAPSPETFNTRRLAVYYKDRNCCLLLRRCSVTYIWYTTLETHTDTFTNAENEV